MDSVSRPHLDTDGTLLGHTVEVTLDTRDPKTRAIRVAGCYDADSEHVRDILLTVGTEVVEMDAKHAAELAAALGLALAG